MGGYKILVPKWEYSKQDLQLSLGTFLDKAHLQLEVKLRKLLFLKRNLTFMTFQ